MALLVKRRWLPAMSEANWARLRPHIHLLFLATAALPLVPLLLHLRLPLVWPWMFIVLFTADVLKKSILAAALLWAFANRGEWAPVARRLREHPWQTALFLLCCAVLLPRGQYVYPLADVFVVWQFVQHKRERQESIFPGVLATAVAGLYLVTALFLAFTYNDVVVSLKFYGGYDDIFQRLDLRLFGTTSSILAHRAATILPKQAFRSFEYVYSSMFWVLGATVAICGLTFGLKRAMQFAGAILIAQFLAVSTFYLWPSHGPYYSCPDHFARILWMLPTYELQRKTLQDAQLIWAHARLTRLPFEYYLSFPCTHIAQPLIAVWFLRQWKSLMLPLGIYCVVLSAAIVLLEWHYLVDLLGGIVIAAIATWAVGDLRQISAASPQEGAARCTQAAEITSESAA